MLFTASVSSTQPPHPAALYSLDVIDPVPLRFTAPASVALSLYVPPIAPDARCCVVVSDGVAQFEMLMFAGPTRSFIWAVVERPEVRDSPKAVPNCSHALPLLLKPDVAAVRSIPA